MKVAFVELCFLVLLLLISGCGVSQDEVARTQSPDGKLDAVLVETNGGATTSFGYKVFVVKKGANYSTVNSVADLYGAIRNSNAYGAKLVWRSAKELEVQFLSAKSSNVESSFVEVSGQKIGVYLRPGVSDPTAPGGGMLYNREKY
ncbi:MAG: hypothetical protein KDI83_06730 [Gammaproteobacteria bacterium]|nr:hypothetical protein [Gammaproteobacteria bacterium]